MDRFVGKIAVVTGSSSGIGRAIVKELVKKGLIVVGLARNLDSQKELAEEILNNKTQYVGKFFTFKCDITQEQEIQETFVKIRSQIGDGIAVLINNAGVIENNLQLTNVDIEEFDRIFWTNAKGLLLCVKEAIQSMSANNFAGHIININSIGSLPEFSSTFLPLATASKHAARSLSHALRTELKQKKSLIKISNISPGAVDTSIYQSIGTLIGHLNKIEFILTAEDIARACVQVLDTPVHVQHQKLVGFPLFLGHVL